MQWATTKPYTWLSATSRMSACLWPLTRWTDHLPVVSRPRMRLAILSPFLVFAVMVFAASCGNDASSAVLEIGQLTATAAPTASGPIATLSVPPAATGETHVFPRHGEEIPPNRGNQYVHGELSLLDGCLRISYADQVDREATRNGLLVVWPVGFEAQSGDRPVVVTGADGSVVAAEGQTLRLSGKKVSRESTATAEWNWEGGEVGHCVGPYWLVGDEVTAMGSGATSSPPADGIYLPRLDHQRGPIVSPAALAEGRLTLRGRCLLVEPSDPPGKHLFVIWPPGFNVHRAGDDLLVVNGGGSVIAQVGDVVRLGGGYAKEGENYSDECPGDYFKAYSVQRSPVAQHEDGK